MKWNSADVEIYVKSKEYVDTIVLPLLPVSFGDDIKQAASMTEFISLLSMQLERQFKGRIMLLPGFTYLTADPETSLSNIKRWEQEFRVKQFQHIFYLTSDSNWKQHEAGLHGSLIWLPSLQIGNLDENYKTSILEDQVKQLLNLFVQKWREKES
ncbi:YpiF family protein [Bacillus sp. T33-2]|uniref:YpiF family protein n=1 Tax=Bacillus sp. T33-2 TaxID=2054168 RepID=UPI000C77014C|nr:YpiF family protein [Bacillus sp. T33-2]PLR99735.1 DUF2487 domain-containing protein [Bacillus sp. T33-2]